MYRVATPDDAKMMKKCNEICLPENYPIELWKRLLTEAPDISILAMQNPNRLKGYILMSKHDDPHVVNLSSLAVMHKFRRQGIGRKLIDESLERIKSHYPKVQCVRLHVRKSNLSAITLYEKAGFKKAKLIERYYPDEDGWEMEKPVGCLMTLANIT